METPPQVRHTLSPFRAVRGQNWKKRDISEWKEKTFLQFFEVVQRFTITKGLTQSVKITAEGLIKLEQDAFTGQFPFLEEFVMRMGQLTSDHMASTRKFSLKFFSAMRQVGQYIREHPSVVTDAMKEVIEKHPRLAWSIEPYVRKESKIGVPLVIENKMDNVQGTREVVKTTDPQIKFMESVMKATDLTHRLLKGVTNGDLKNLSTKDRVSLGFAGIKLLSAMKSYKPNIGVFNQINIKAAGRDELEEAMLNLNQTKE